ncbi:cytochrome c oxidase subunit II [Thalassobacillus sp. C254]|uniref:cytochrome c oxidase subunit II n=1 Tax=Thalassobacillus sp. C254 TaxID=1225341 RepID=UPI0006D26746|nr:cytochrome c oxidase subunit II [Thalassobacillus sp. C254]
MMWKYFSRFLPLTALLLFLAGCGEQRMTALDPMGPQSQWIFDNMILSLYVMALVIIVVFALFFIAVVKFRKKPGDNEIPEQVEGSHKLEITWTVIPILLLVVLAIPTLTGTFLLADTEPEEGDEDAVVIDVTGHQYWWQFDYEEGFTASNDVYIPVGEKVTFNLHASDVIHSFWVPALGGKVDNLPGVENALWLEADEPGVYMGKCAELCGPSHALMDFKLIALERDDYDAWVESMQEDPEEELEETVANQGREVFEDQGCIGCHAIGGSGSAAGPTLTNFGDRETIANYLEMNEENLEAWIREPQALKQGNNMPEYPDMPQEEMDALVDYLMELSVMDEEE